MSAIEDYLGFPLPKGGGVEVVTIDVDGVPWTAFESITVEAAFNDAARSFSFIAAFEAGKSATNAIFVKGRELSISANGDLLLAGAVNRKQPLLEPKKAQLTVSGRSLSQDLVDGSAEHDTGDFEDKDPLQIGQEIASKYRPRFESDQQLHKVEQYKLTQGESCFRCIEKLARQQGMTLAGTPEGNINITKADGAKRHAGGLIEGQTILKGGADHNDANQHSEITMRGQRPFGHGAEAIEIEKIARESGVKRHRPLIVIQDNDTTPERTKKRVTNLRDRKAGDALKASVVVQSFRDQSGQVWTPGWLVWMESPTLDIAQDMLIERATYQQDDGGSITTLSLVDPRSYGGKGGKGNQSGSEWSQDSSEAE